MTLFNIIKVTSPSPTRDNPIKTVINTDQVAYYVLNEQGLTIYFKGIDTPAQFAVGSTSIPLEQICTQIDDALRPLNNSLFVQIKSGSDAGKAFILINKKEIRKLEWSPRLNPPMLEIWTEEDHHDGDTTYTNRYEFYEDEVSPSLSVIYEEIKSFGGNNV